MKIFKTLILLLFVSAAFCQRSVPFQQMPLWYQMRAMYADSTARVPVLNMWYVPFNNKDSSGSMWYWTSQNAFAGKWGTVTRLFASQDWVTANAVNIYSANGILTSNRTLTGKNNTYNLTFDSIGFFNVYANGFTNTASLGAEKTYIVHQYDNIGLRISDPGLPYVDATLNRSDTSVTLTVANKGTLKKLIMQQDTLSYNGTLKASHLSGTYGTPTVSIGTDFIGTASVVGNDISGTVTVTITSGGSFPTLAAYFQLNFAVPYSTAPHVVISPQNSATTTLPAIYVKNKSTTSFQVATANSGTAPGSATYIWDYHVIQ
jgi:hypothetical protein